MKQQTLPMIADGADPRFLERCPNCGNIDSDYDQCGADDGCLFCLACGFHGVMEEWPPPSADELQQRAEGEEMMQRWEEKRKKRKQKP